MAIVTILDHVDGATFPNIRCLLLDVSSEERLQEAAFPGSRLPHPGYAVEH